MTSKIEGISAETVIARAIEGQCYRFRKDRNTLLEKDTIWFEYDDAASAAKAILKELLASGDVVLRKDVEELVKQIRKLSIATAKPGQERDVAEDMQEIAILSKRALAKFTTKQEG